MSTIDTSLCNEKKKKRGFARLCKRKKKKKEKRFAEDAMTVRTSQLQTTRRWQLALLLLPHTCVKMQQSRYVGMQKRGKKKGKDGLKCSRYEKGAHCDAYRNFIQCFFFFFKCGGQSFVSRYKAARFLSFFFFLLLTNGFSVEL